MSNSLWSLGPEPARLFSPWDSPGKNPGVGCHALLQGIFLTQGSNPHLLCLLYWQAGSLPLDPRKTRMLEPNSLEPWQIHNWLWNRAFWLCPGHCHWDMAGHSPAMIVARGAKTQQHIPCCPPQLEPRSCHSTLRPLPGRWKAARYVCDLFR